MSGPLCAPGVDSPAVVQTPAGAPFEHFLNLFLIRTLLQNRFSLFSSWGKEGRRGEKKREAADSKRRIKVQHVLGAKSREGTRGGGGSEEGAAH